MISSNTNHSIINTNYSAQQLASTPLTSRCAYYLLHLICCCAATLTIFALTSCRDSGYFRLKGEIEHLAEADFFIYSPDGGISQIDTIHVLDGHFDWRTPLTEESTFVIVYPNYSEQTIFAQPGDVITLKGDATQLRDVSITGSTDNETLTQFRLAHSTAKPEQIRKDTEDFISRNPGSRVAIYLQRRLAASDAHQSRLRIGDKLPVFSLPPDQFFPDADTLTPDNTPLLIIFWATWSGQSHNFNTHAHKVSMLHSYGNTAKPNIISISLDTDTRSYRDFLRRDSVTWTARCTRQAWATPIVQQIGLTQIPFAILTDEKRRILALGSDWEKDIQPTVDKLYKK